MRFLLRVMMLFVMISFVYLYSLSLTKVCGATPDASGTVNLTMRPQLWTNAKSAEITVLKQEKNAISLHMDTRGQKKDYYTATLYSTSFTELNHYGAIAFSIKNNKNEPLYVNFSAQTVKNHYLTVAKNNRSLLQSAGDERWKIITNPYGSFAIPAHFSGRIAFLLNTVTESGKKTDLTSLQSWGLSVFSPQANTVDATFASVQGYTKKVAKQMDLDSNFIITGDSQIQIPDLGESVYRYTLKGKTVHTKNMHLHLEQPVKGVTVSRNGLITLSPDAQNKSINLIEENGQGYYTVKKVKLYYSNYRHLYQSDGSPAFFPTPKTVKQIVPRHSFLFNHSFYIGLRIALVILVGFVILLYLYFRSRLKFETKHQSRHHQTQRSVHSDGRQENSNF